MGRRFQARIGNGRFTRNTMENTFGLSVPVCPHCGRFNPHGIYEPAPTTCHACGQPMQSVAAREGTETGGDTDGN